MHNALILDFLLIKLMNIGFPISTNIHINFGLDVLVLNHYCGFNYL